MVVTIKNFFKRGVNLVVEIFGSTRFNSTNQIRKMGECFHDLLRIFCQSGIGKILFLVTELGILTNVKIHSYGLRSFEIENSNLGFQKGIKAFKSYEYILVAGFLLFNSF